MSDHRVTKTKTKTIYIKKERKKEKKNHKKREKRTWA